MLNRLTYHAIKVSKNQVHSDENLASITLENPVFAAVFPAFAWIVAWNTQLWVTDLVQLPNFLSAVYFTSGVQIFSGLLFHLRGLVSSYVGSILAFWMFPDARYPASMLEFSLLTFSLTIIAYASIELVRRSAKLNDNFDGVSARSLFSIVVLYNLISTFSHYFWTTQVSNSLRLPTEYVVLEFCSRVIGSFIVMYCLLWVFELAMKQREEIQ